MSMIKSGIELIECGTNIDSDDYKDFFLEVIPNTQIDLVDLLVLGEISLIKCMDYKQAHKCSRIGMNEKDYFYINKYKGVGSYRFSYRINKRTEIEEKSLFRDSDKCKNSTYYFQGSVEEFLEKFKSYYENTISKP